MDPGTQTVMLIAKEVPEIESEDLDLPDDDVEAAAEDDSLSDSAGEETADSETSQETRKWRRWGFHPNGSDEEDESE